MRTFIHRFIYFLIDKGLLRAYLDATGLDYIDSLKNLLTTESPHDLIKCCFIWKDTTEGYTYWENIYLDWSYMLLKEGTE